MAEYSLLPTQGPSGAVQPFTGVGGFAYLRHKVSKQMQLAQLAVSRNDALPPSSLHKLHQLYVQGIPADSGAARWAQDHKAFLSEALLCAIHNTVVHHPHKLPKAISTLHPEDEVKGAIDLHELFVQCRTAFYTEHPDKRPITTVYRQHPQDDDLVVPHQGRLPAQEQARQDDPRSRTCLHSPNCELPEGFDPHVRLPASNCANIPTKEAVHKFIRHCATHDDVPCFDELWWAAADAAFCKATPTEQAAYLRCYPDKSEVHDPASWAEKLRLFWRLTGNEDDAQAKSALCSRYVEGLDMIQDKLTDLVAAKRMDLDLEQQDDLDVLQQLAQKCYHNLLKRSTYYLHNPAPSSKQHNTNMTSAAGTRSMNISKAPTYFKNTVTATSGYPNKTVNFNTNKNFYPVKSTSTSPPPRSSSESKSYGNYDRTNYNPHNGKASGSAAVTKGPRQGQPPCLTCGRPGHPTDQCFVTNPAAALKMFPDYCGPADPELHKLYIQSCRRQGVVPRPYQAPVRKSALNANILYDTTHCKPTLCTDKHTTADFQGNVAAGQRVGKKLTPSSPVEGLVEGQDEPQPATFCKDDYTEQGELHDSKPEDDHSQDEGSDADMPPLMRESSVWLQPANAAFFMDMSGRCHIPPAALVSQVGSATEVVSSTDGAQATSAEPPHPANMIACVMTRSRARQLHAVQPGSQVPETVTDADNTGSSGSNDDRPLNSPTYRDAGLNIEDFTTVRARVTTDPATNKPDVPMAYLPTAPSPDRSHTPDEQDPMEQETTTEGQDQQPPAGEPLAVGHEPHKAANPVPFSNITGKPLHARSPRAYSRARRRGHARAQMHSHVDTLPTNMTSTSPSDAAIISPQSDHQLTLRELFDACHDKHVMQFVCNTECAYQPRSTQSGTPAVVPADIVRWQACTIPVPHNIYQLCKKPHLHIAERASSAQITLSLDMDRADFATCALLRDLLTHLAEFRRSSREPAALMTNFQSASRVPGMMLREQLQKMQPCMFTLPPTTHPSEGYSIIAPTQHGTTVQLRPPRVLADSGANCNVITESYFRKHNLQGSAFEGKLDTSAEQGVRAEIIGTVIVDMVLKQGTPDQLVSKQLMYVIAGENHIYDIILGTPALLDMGAYVDPPLSQFVYRPKWATVGNLQCTASIPAQVAMVSEAVSTYAPLNPAPKQPSRILQWREPMPAILCTQLPNQTETAMQVTSTPDEEHDSNSGNSDTRSEHDTIPDMGAPEEADSQDNIEDGTDQQCRGPAHAFDDHHNSTPHATLPAPDLNCYESLSPYHGGVVLRRVPRFHYNGSSLPSPREIQRTSTVTAVPSMLTITQPCTSNPNTELLGTPNIVRDLFGARDISLANHPAPGQGYHIGAPPSAAYNDDHDSEPPPGDEAGNGEYSSGRHGGSHPTSGGDSPHWPADMHAMMQQLAVQRPRVDRAWLYLTAFVCTLVWTFMMALLVTAAMLSRTHI